MNSAARQRNRAAWQTGRFRHKRPVDRTITLAGSPIPARDTSIVSKVKQSLSTDRETIRRWALGLRICRPAKPLTLRCTLKSIGTRPATSGRSRSQSQVSRKPVGMVHLLFRRCKKFRADSSPTDSLRRLSCGGRCRTAGQYRRLTRITPRPRLRLIACANKSLTRMTPGALRL